MNAFQVLKDGLSFDRQRFSHDFELFSCSNPDPGPTKKPKLSESGFQAKVVVHGQNVPAVVESFSDLFESVKFREGIKEYVTSSYESPTLVQKHAIPVALAKRELIAIAPTGSGKTLGFLLPLLKLIKPGRKLRALILCPTKELAKQTYRECLLLGEHTKFRFLCLSKKSPASETWQDSFDILIATPLLCVHLLGETMLATIRFVVFDEVDQLFEMGYMEQIECILKKCRQEKVVKWMFSATILPAIELLAKSIMIDPVTIQIGRANTTVAKVDQSLLFCSNELGKLTAVRQMIHTGELTPPVLVFVQSKHRAKELHKELVTENVHVGVIHSDLMTAEREVVVKQFRQGVVWVLICTDLMSRGIDFQDVKLVINYDFPQSMVSYIHRIGRTGRRGLSGKAITFYTFEDAPYVRMVTNVMEKSGCEVPAWLKTLKNPSRKAKKALETKPVKRERVAGGYGLSRTLRKKMHRGKVEKKAESS